MILGTTGVINAQPDMHVVAAAPTVASLRTWEVSFDVVLLDLSLGDSSTPAANVNALQTMTQRIIAYTAGERPDLVRQAARAGVDGVIRKSEEPGHLIDAIHQVMQGRTAISADWADALDADADFVAARLTSREAEVLALYASGENAERVAAALFISKETVYDHVSRIRAKYAELDRPAPTKVDLLRRAIEDGIVSVDVAL
jgi:DNA-binding NarL/FixJ family response regulator